jgi:hypothetical protein
MDRFYQMEGEGESPLRTRFGLTEWRRTQFWFEPLLVSTTLFGFEPNLIPC